MKAMVHYLTPPMMQTYAARGRGMIGMLTDGRAVTEEAKSFACALSCAADMRDFLEELQAADAFGSCALSRHMRLALRELLWQARHRPKHGELVLASGKVSIGEKG
jgi:hypothetical protein